VGARLGHCLFYDPDYYLSHPLEILMIWKGGLASHGAALGIITGLILWSRVVSKRSAWWVLDRIVIMVALSGLFIRTGNLANSEILGSPTQSSIGVVFPRADQSDDFRAKWQGQDVEIRYIPTDPTERNFGIFRLDADSSLTYLSERGSKLNMDGVEGYRLMDRNAGLRPKHYMAVASSPARLIRVAPEDSLDNRNIYLTHEFGGSAAFTGTLKGNQLQLHFALNGLAQNGSAAFLFIRVDDSTRFHLVGRGTFSGGPATTSIDTVVTLPSGVKSTEYMVLHKTKEIHLTARHASMMYEAVAYTIIFFFLLWLYFKMNGRIPRGLLFGIFLITVFGVRILIEALKENQEAFDLGLPLNMGQLLSVPFVLFGIFCVVWSLRKGYIEERPFPPAPEPKAKPEAKK
jgi:prolipoprotein diacylglyceryltransferase